MLGENQGHLEVFLIKGESIEDSPFSFHLPLIFSPCRLKLTPHPKGPTQAINLNDVLIALWINRYIDLFLI